MLETSLIHDISYNFLSAEEALLSWLSSAVWQNRDALFPCDARKYYLHFAALFIEALKVFPDFQQNISVIMATSLNRGIGGITEDVADMNL